MILFQQNGMYLSLLKSMRYLPPKYHRNITSRKIGAYLVSYFKPKNQFSKIIIGNVLTLKGKD
jgi:hypothetical protein